MKKILKTNIFSFILGGLIFATVGVAATTLFNATDVGYTGNKVENAENIQQAIDGLYDKASSIECGDGYEKGSATSIGGYECRPLPWQPKYYAFGDITASSPTTPPSGKNIYTALDDEGNKGVCIMMNGQQHCFKINNWDFENEHIQQVFAGMACNGDSGGIACYATGGLSCRLYSDGDACCNDSNDYCDVFMDGRIACGKA